MFHVTIGDTGGIPVQEIIIEFFDHVKYDTKSKFKVSQSVIMSMDVAGNPSWKASL